MQVDLLSFLNNNKNIDEQLLQSFTNFSTLLESYEIQLKISSSPTDYKRFFSLPIERKKTILKRFNAMFKTYQDVVNSNHSPEDNLALLWQFISKSGLKPSSDLFGKITKNDIFEIYDAQSVQVFCNLNFFKICSYSLCELLGYELWELYKRDESISISLFEKVGKIFNKEINYAIEASVPDHIAEEVFSEKKNKYLVKQKIIAPLTDKNGYPTAVVGTFEVLKQLGTQ